MLLWIWSQHSGNPAALTASCCKTCWKLCPAVKADQPLHPWAPCWVDVGSQAAKMRRTICRAKVTQVKGSHKARRLACYGGHSEWRWCGFRRTGGEQKLIASHEVGSEAAHWCAPRWTLWEFRFQWDSSRSFLGILWWNHGRQIHPQFLAISTEECGPKALRLVWSLNLIPRRWSKDDLAACLEVKGPVLQHQNQEPCSVRAGLVLNFGRISSWKCPSHCRDSEGIVIFHKTTRVAVKQKNSTWVLQDEL